MDFFDQLAGLHEIDLPAARQVHRDDGVLAEPAALHEQDAEVGGHGQQFAQVGFGFCRDLHELLAAMAHLHHADATAVPVEHLGGRLAQHGLPEWPPDPARS